MKDSIWRLCLVKLELGLSHAFILKHSIFILAAKCTLNLVGRVMIDPLSWRWVILSLSFRCILPNLEVLLSLPVSRNLNDTRTLLPLIWGTSLDLWKLRMLPWGIKTTSSSLPIGYRNVVNFWWHLLMRDVLQALRIINFNWFLDALFPWVDHQILLWVYLFR